MHVPPPQAALSISSIAALCLWRDVDKIPAPMAPEHRHRKVLPNRHKM
jgi:hypothetical protein